MPFGHWENFDACLADIKKKNPSYSDEVAKKVCGKLKSKLEKGEALKETPLAATEERSKEIDKEYASSKPSPSIKDMKEITPGITKSWVFDPSEILKSKRVVEGTFHVPIVDKDKELITKSAMSDALPDFMHLPILHDFHKERVLGVIVKAWEEGDHFKFRALFKSTHDVDDAWEKVSKGEYDHVSIYGSRIAGTAQCALDPSQRAAPCISNRIRLDSISACDENARNDEAFMKVSKGKDRFVINLTDTFIKAETQNSSLVHGTWDGVKNIKEAEYVTEKYKIPIKQPTSRGEKILPAVKDIVELGMMHDKRKVEKVEKGKVFHTMTHNRADLSSHGNEKMDAVRDLRMFEREDSSSNKRRMAGVEGLGEMTKKAGMKDNYIDPETGDYEGVKPPKQRNGGPQEGEYGYNPYKDFEKGKEKGFNPAPGMGDRADVYGNTPPGKPESWRREEQHHKEHRAADDFQLYGGSVWKADSGMLQKIYDILLKLVQSDKEVHSKLKKSDEDDYRPGRKDPALRDAQNRKEDRENARIGDDEEDEVEKGTRPGTAPDLSNPEKYKRTKDAQSQSEMGEGRGGFARNRASWDAKRKRDEFDKSDEEDEVDKAYYNERIADPENYPKPLKPKEPKFEPDKKEEKKCGCGEHDVKKGTHEENLKNMKDPEKRKVIDNRYGEGFSDKYEEHNKDVKKSDKEVSDYAEKVESWSKDRDYNREHREKSPDMRTRITAKLEGLQQPTPKFPLMRKSDTMDEKVEDKKEIQKAEVETKVEPKAEDSVEILKANLELDINKIVKAQTDEISKAITENLMKAFDEKIKPLEEKIKKIEEQPIAKAAVIIPEQVEMSDTNYSALGQFMKRG